MNSATDLDKRFSLVVKRLQELCDHRGDDPDNFGLPDDTLGKALVLAEYLDIDPMPFFAPNLPLEHCIPKE